MKKIYFLFLFPSLIFNIEFSFAQGGTWTWISGDSAANSAGVFGIQGVPSVSNHPPSLYEASEWKDKQGNFWIFGGAFSPILFYSDLWKFNPATLEWTWVKGNGLTNQSPVYGTQGMADSLNTPGERPLAAASWVDTSGNFWLFGGLNCSNDLWRYDAGANQWTWMKGNKTAMAHGVHGTQGVPNMLNNPGSRNETCSAWTDSMNNLWLFGGDGYDDVGAVGVLNDLCKYDIASNEWTWIKGSAYVNAAANYGIKAVANTTNDPGGRFSYTKWKDKEGNFWIMGGATSYSNSFNDIWKYDFSSNEWIWMNGTSTNENVGKYAAACSFDTLNLPYSRAEQRASVTDNCGRFWLLGGANFNGGSYSSLNDIWVLDPQQLKWNWIKGTNIFNQPGNYGMLGVASLSNTPPPRMGAVAWWGNDDKIYMFGGVQALIAKNNYYADVWVFNPDTACISVCNAVAVAPPVANFQASKDSLCANDCINFTDLSSNATAWQWSFAGALDSVSNAQNPQGICYAAAGIYNVNLVASNSGGKDSVTFGNYIKVIASPAAPLITQQHDTLYCGAASSVSYQWSFDSTLISGATDTFLVASQSGNYNVQVTNNNGCKTATGINIALGIQNYANDNIISLSPDPVRDKFTINDLRFTIGHVEIYNVLGQVCGKSEIVNRKSEIEIDVSALPSGIYFMEVVGDNGRQEGRWEGKFIKE